MASGQNLALQILINARDQASSVLEKVKGKFIALGAAIGGGALFGSSVKEAATFEQAMDGVAAKMGIVAEEGGEGAVALQKLEAAAKEAGSSTKFSATEAANALQVLAASGLDADSQIASLTPTLNLAAIEGLELADAASIIGDVSAQMNIPMAEAGRIADVLAKGATLANTSVSQLGNAMKQAGSLAAASGMSFEQTVGALNVLANAGIRGEEAGTALRNILGQLSDPASKAREELRKLGVDTNELGPAFDAIAQGGEQGQVALRAFGVEATGAAIALQKAGSEGIAGFAGQLQDVAGAAERSAKIASDNFFGMVDSLKSAISGAAIEFATPILKPLSDQVTQLAEKVREFTASDAFGAMSQAMVSAFNAAAAAVGEFLGKIDWQKLGNDIAAFAGNAKTYLDSFAQNVAAVGSAVQAMGAAASLVWNSLTGVVKTFAAGVAQMSAGVLSAYASMVEGANKLGLASDESAKKARQSADDMQAAYVRLRDSALNDFGKAGEAVADLGGHLLDTGKKAIEAGQNIASAKAPVDELAQTIQERFGPGIEQAMANLAARTREYAQAVQDAANGDEQAAAKIEVLKLAMEDARQAVADAKAEAEDYRAKQEALAAAQEAVSKAAKAYSEASQTAANATGANAEAAAEAAAKLPTLKAELDAAQHALDLLTGAATKAGSAVKESGQAMEAAKPSATQVQAALLELTNKYNELKAAGDDVGAEAIAAQMQRIAAEAANTGQALKRGADDTGRYAEASREANARVDGLATAIANGQAAQERDRDLKRELAEANARMKDALDDATAAIDRQVAAMQRDADIAQAKLDLQIKQLEREQALAEAKGEAAKAAEIALDIAHLEVDAADRSAQAQYAQADALTQKADLTERAAMADGALSDEERDMIDALRDAAEMAKIEAQSLDVSTASKKDNAAAAAAAADASNQQARAAQNNAQAQEKEAAALDKKKQSQKSSGDDGATEDSSLMGGGSYRFVLDPQLLADTFQNASGDIATREKMLQEYIESWVGPNSEYIGDRIEKVRAIWEQDQEDLYNQLIQHTEETRRRNAEIEAEYAAKLAEMEAASRAAREAAAESAGKLKDTMSEVAELSKAASGGIDINRSNEVTSTATVRNINETVVTHRIEIDAAKLFADEANVNEFIRALERAGLRVT